MIPTARTLPTVNKRTAAHSANERFLPFRFLLITMNAPCQVKQEAFLCCYFARRTFAATMVKAGITITGMAAQPTIDVPCWSIA